MRFVSAVAVLDNEAAQALADPTHRKHPRMLAILAAAAGRNRRTAGSVSVVVPTAVRVEALLDRGAPRAAELGRLRVSDVPLDTGRADRAARLRSAAGGSTVDAIVVEAAERLAADGGLATVYSADLADLPRLAARSARPERILIRRL
ncbi:MAG: hypothetical protein ABJC62_00590 [Frankiaceae bacterium]